MNIYITLDYELFFGTKSGTAENCIIKPTERLLQILDVYGVKATFFVDSGYLTSLERQKEEFEELSHDLKKIIGQIKALTDQGHAIGLHIHPHWEDSQFDGKAWVFDTKRYRLFDFNHAEANQIIEKHIAILERHSGIKPIAYRAGGWSAQPFDHIKDVLKKNGILIDSTVYPGGKYQSENQYFDFTGVPRYKTSYRFSDDLTVEDANGAFTEIPISSFEVSPMFYWNFASKKFLKQKKHLPFGDGQAIAMEKNNVVKLLTRSSISVVSMDGYKASLLKKALSKYKKNTADSGNFVIIGHPKAFTEYSLEKVNEFIKATHDAHTYKTFR